MLSLKEIVQQISAEPPKLDGYLTLTDGIIHVIKNKVHINLKQAYVHACWMYYVNF